MPLPLTFPRFVCHFSQHFLKRWVTGRLTGLSDDAVSIQPAQRSVKWWFGHRKHLYLINFAYSSSKEFIQFSLNSGLTNMRRRTYCVWWVISKLKIIFEQLQRVMHLRNTLTAYRALQLLVDCVMKTLWSVLSWQRTNVLLSWNHFEGIVGDARLR